MTQSDESGKSRKTKSNHPIALSVTLLAGICFVLLTIWGAFDKHVGHHLNVGHWTIDNLYLLFGVLAFASMLTAFVLSKMPRRWSRMSIGLSGTLLWLVTVTIVGLFIFRESTELYVDYSDYRVEDSIPGTPENRTF